MQYIEKTGSKKGICKRKVGPWASSTVIYGCPQWMGQGRGGVERAEGGGRGSGSQTLWHYKTETETFIIFLRAITPTDSLSENITFITATFHWGPECSMQALRGHKSTTPQHWAISLNELIEGANREHGNDAEHRSQSPKWSAHSLYFKLAHSKPGWALADP